MLVYKRYSIFKQDQAVLELKLCEYNFNGDLKNRPDWMFNITYVYETDSN